MSKILGGSVPPEHLAVAMTSRLVLSAATALRYRPDICFLFISDGHYRPTLEQEVAARGLTNTIAATAEEVAQRLTKKWFLWTDRSGGNRRRRSPA
jgi:hypothetical protein